MEEWPPEYKEKVIIGNKTSNVGIATLWTIKEHVAEVLDPNDFCIVANYYDVYNGLEPMLRNCLSNPNIRYILIVGADKSGSKETLLKFFSEGIENGLVKGMDVEIPKDIPVEDIELLRKSVELIDLTSHITDLNNFSQYKNAIETRKKNLEKKNPYTEPKSYPKTPDIIDVFPSNGVLYTIEDEFIGKTWLRILNTVNSYGNKTWTSHEESSEVRECVNVVSVITREDPYNPKMEEYFRFSKDDITNYYKEFCYDFIPEGVSYTYGSRFRGGGCDQVQMIINKLKGNPFSKRAYASTWDGKTDMDNPTPPCVISIQPNIQKNILFMTCYIRSNDMYRAYPLNAFGLRKLQKMISDKLECKLGPLTIISQSAHVYKDNFKDMKKIVDAYYTSTNCFDDPRGYYVINTDLDKILVDHYSPTSKLLKSYNGFTCREITDQINSSCHPINPYHISYLGEELMKAEISIKFGFVYTQDLELKKKDDE